MIEETSDTPPAEPAQAPRPGKLARLREKAKKRGLLSKRGRPVGSGGPAHGGAPEAGDVEDRALRLVDPSTGVPANPAAAPGGASPAAVAIHADLKDVVSDYRLAGEKIFNWESRRAGVEVVHDHWRVTDPQDLENGAVAMERILQKLPPNVAAGVINTLIVCKTIGRGIAVFVAPVWVSVGLLQEAKKRKTAEPAPGGELAAQPA